MLSIERIRGFKLDFTSCVVISPQNSLWLTTDGGEHTAMYCVEPQQGPFVLEIIKSVRSRTVVFVGLKHVEVECNFGS